jgi:hypothetical protein
LSVGNRKFSDAITWFAMSMFDVAVRRRCSTSLFGLGRPATRLP